MGHYAWFNISDNAKLCTGYYIINSLSNYSCILYRLSFQTISLVAEGFLFTYLGISSVALAREEWSPSLVFFEMGIFLVARFCGIFLLSGIHM